MDRISLLPDELLLSIMTFLPTKVAVTTSLLSKRWCSLWKIVPQLWYQDPAYGDSSRAFLNWIPSRFIDKFLLLHEAPVLTTLRLILGQRCPLSDMEVWIRIATSRGLRHLLIFRNPPGPGLAGPLRLPISLYTCETLVTLHLHTVVSVDDVPLRICFRSLKVMILTLVIFSRDEMVRRLLAGCPVLQDLRVLRRSSDNVKTFTITVPSLERLTIIDLRSSSRVPGVDVGFVINAPCLKSLKIANQYSWFYSLVKMPYLVNADIKLRQGDCFKFNGCFDSAKDVSLCLKPPMESRPIGVFNQLVSLNLCVCSLDWCRHILGHAPQLRVLRFEPRQVRICGNLGPLQGCSISSVSIQTQWEQPDSVPHCLISSLKKVEWSDYKGTQAEKKVLVYLLENSVQLQIVTVRSLRSSNLAEKLKMVQEVTAFRRSSTKCSVNFT